MAATQAVLIRHGVTTGQVCSDARHESDWVARPVWLRTANQDGVALFQSFHQESTHLKNYVCNHVPWLFIDPDPEYPATMIPSSAGAPSPGPAGSDRCLRFWRMPSSSAWRSTPSCWSTGRSGFTALALHCLLCCMTQCMALQQLALHGGLRDVCSCGRQLYQRARSEADDDEEHGVKGASLPKHIPNGTHSPGSPIAAKDQFTLMNSSFTK